MPILRMSAPIRSPMRWTSSGENVAPHDNGTGYAVAPQAAKPARHSSWARAGIPKRDSETIRRCERRSETAPAAGSTGAVP